MSDPKKSEQNPPPIPAKKTPPKSHPWTLYAVLVGLIVVTLTVAVVVVVWFYDSAPPSVEKETPYEIGITVEQWLYAINKSHKSDFVDLDVPGKFLRKPQVYKGDKSSSIKLMAEQPPKAATLWRIALTMELSEFNSNKPAAKSLIVLADETANLINYEHDIDFEEAFAKAKHQSFCKCMVDDTVQVVIGYGMPGEPTSPDDIPPKLVGVLFDVDYGALRDQGIIDENYELKNWKNKLP